MKKTAIMIITMAFLAILSGGNKTMSDKNIQIVQRNESNSEWDNLYPITKAKNVLTNNGTVASELAEAVKKVNGNTPDSTGNVEIEIPNPDLSEYATKTELTGMATKSEVAIERARIDNFATLSEGSTTGDAELVDGRVGGDGITYNNVGSAIRGQFNKLKDGLGKYYLQEIEMISGYNINLSGGVGSEVSLTPEEVGFYRYAIVDCVENDLFTINGLGGTNPRLWGFIDSNNVLLSVALPDLNVSNNLMLIAPKNASKLIINDSNSGRKSYIGYKLDDINHIDRNRVSRLEESLYGEEIKMTDNYYIGLGSVGIGNIVNMTPSNLGDYRYAEVKCSAGDVFIINGEGGANPRLWGFADSDNMLLSVADAYAKAKDYRLVAPPNSAKLIINDLKTGGTCYKGVGISQKIEKYESKIDVAYADRLEMIGEDYMTAMVNGIAFADQIANNMVADFKKPGDLMVHVSTFTIINDVVYMTYYANTRSTSEIAEEQTARFAYCDLSDTGNITFVDLQDVGDEFNGKTVTAIYDTILMRKDDTELYLMWTAQLNGVYYRLFRTFNVNTKELGVLRINGFKVGDTLNDFSVPGMESAFRDNNIKHKPLEVDIGIMQTISTRVENGTTYYYTGCYANRFNCIIKSCDLVSWEYVATPDFIHDGQFENAVYVLNDKVYYFLRQEWKNNFGILTYYDLQTGEWAKPVHINDCQSRSDFFYHGGNLYLIHAPKDRNHLEIIKINTGSLSQSIPVLTAKVPDYFYPFVQSYNNELYISFTQSRQHIWLSKFEIGTISSSTVESVFRTMFGLD